LNGLQDERVDPDLDGTSEVDEEEEEEDDDGLWGAILKKD